MQTSLISSVLSWIFLWQTALCVLLSSTLSQGSECSQLLQHHGADYVSENRSAVNLDSSISWNDKIYYSGQSAIFGNELWVSDGTDAGTKMIRDIATLSNHSSPRNFITTQDHLYFIANNNNYRQNLCRIDRNNQLTILHEFNAGFKIHQTRAVGHKIFVSLIANYSNMYHVLSDLYAYDSRTNKVDYIGSYHISTIYEKQLWTVFGDTLYLANGYTFSGFNAYDIPKIWKTSGIAGDLKEFQRVSLAAATDGETWNGNYYYIAGIEYGKNALFRLNQITNSPELLFELPSSVSTLYPRSLTFNAGAMYFVAANSSRARSLWRSDGTTEGTIAVDPKVVVNSRDHLEKINGKLYYLQYGNLTDQNRLMRIEDDQEINIVSIVPHASYITQWNDKALVTSLTSGTFPSYTRDVTIYQNDGTSTTNKKLLTHSVTSSGYYNVPFIKTKDFLYYGRNGSNGSYSYYKFTESNSTDEPFTAFEHESMDSISFDEARKELGNAKNLDEKVEVAWDDPATTRFRGMTAKATTHFVYLVDKKNVHFHTNIFVQQSERIVGVKELQGWFYILLFQDDANQSYRICRLRYPDKFHYQHYGFQQMPQIYTHPNGIIFANKSMWIIPKGQDLIQHNTQHISYEPPIVISGQIYYLSGYDGSIRHNDFQGLSDTELVTTTTDSQPIRAASLTSHGNRLLFTSFINGVDQLVHSYPIEKRLHVYDTEPDPHSTSLPTTSNFNAIDYQKTFKATLHSTVGFAKIYAEIRGSQGDSFKIIGNNQWNKWKPNQSQFINVAYTPTDGDQHTAELIFVDQCSNTILSKIDLAGYPHPLDDYVMFTQENGASLPLIDQPIMATLKQNSLLKKHVSKILVYGYSNDNFDRFLITESYELTFVIPPQSEESRFVTIVGLNDQEEIILEWDTYINTLRPHRNDTTPRTFEGLLGINSLFASESGYFLLQQNADQSFSYQIQLGNSSWRGKGQFDSNGAAEFELKSWRPQKFSRLHLQKTIDQYSSKPSLIPIFGTTDEWQVPGYYIPSFLYSIHYREPSSAAFEELQGKRYVINLATSWTQFYKDKKQQTTHSGYHSGVVDYGLNGDTTFTLHHFRQKSLHRKLTPLSDGTFIHYQRAKISCLSLKLNGTDTYLKRHEISGKPLAFLQNTFLSRELPNTPFSAPFFIPLSDEIGLEAYLQLRTKLEYAIFDEIPQQTVASLTNQIGEQLDYQIHEDGTVTGFLRSSGKTLPFTGFYFPPHVDDQESAEIRGVVYRNGEYYGDITLNLWY